MALCSFRHVFRVRCSLGSGVGEDSHRWMIAHLVNGLGCQAISMALNVAPSSLARFVQVRMMNDKQVRIVPFYDPALFREIVTSAYSDQLVLSRPLPA